jgi:hypothetical protein
MWVRSLKKPAFEQLRAFRWLLSGLAFAGLVKAAAHSVHLDYGRFLSFGFARRLSAALLSFAFASSVVTAAAAEAGNVVQVTSQTSSMTSGTAPRAPLDPTRVPANLRQWLPWVLDELGDRSCPVVNNEAVCAWPGRLFLDLDDNGGRFSLTVVADRETFVALPGAKTRWPLDVRMKSGAAIVLEQDGLPTVKLQPGAHEIEGRFQWAQLPETLSIPKQLALVDLRINRHTVERPKRDGALLWLESAPRQGDDQERLEMEVFRRLQDGVPLLVTTLLRLTVSGRAREISLSQLWLEGGVPLGVKADLPVRIDADGSIAVQVFAGKHELVLYEAHPIAQDELFSPNLKAPWPETETWSLSPNDALRQLRLVGVPAADPTRSNVPGEWAALAAYRVTANTKVALITERRGDPNPAPNRLTFERSLWLDLDGEGFTVHDNISGKLSQNWRLDLLTGDLGQAQLEGQPQLITVHPSNGTSGIELREGDLSLNSDWRLEDGSRALPAVGWSESADTLVTQLHLPPGWELLGASGVDQVDHTWLANWDLLGLFFVLVVTFATARLTHVSVGALALLTLTLLHNQNDAPKALWLAVLAAIALLRVVPPGKFRRALRWTGFCIGAALLYVVSIFSVDQLRLAIFPQTQSNGVSDTSYQIPGAAQDKEGGTGKRESAYSSDSDGNTLVRKTAKSGASQAHDPKAVIQTGPGIPDWHFRTWTLSWSGPVHRDHRIRLFLLSPLTNAMLSLVRVGLTGLLAYVLLLLLVKQAGLPPTTTVAKKPGRVAAATGLVMALCCLPKTTRAEFPPQPLLDELRLRASSPPSCEPDCVTVQLAQLEVLDAGMVILTEVHVDALSSTRLPGPDKEWLPSEVRINGQPAAGLTRGEDGFFYARLQPGIYRIEMSGPIKGDTLALNLGTPPHYVQVNAPGWVVSGVNDVGQVETALSLHRKHQSSNQGQPGANGSLSGWLRVHRRLSFGKTWSVVTEIARVGGDDWKADGAVSARIPLLPGERVTTAAVPVEKQAVVVTLEREVDNLEFQSTLEQRSVVSLVAANAEKLSEQRFNEQWTIECSSIWHCELGGLAPLSRQSEGQWRPTFVPWPGERVDIQLSRPEPSNGVSTTIDSAELELTPGVRLLKAHLSTTVRTTSQHSLAVNLPEGAVVSEVVLNGQPQALQLERNTVTIQLQPGHHSVSLAWQEQGGMRAFFRTGEVKLDQHLVNAKVKISIPADRWLLLAGGGGWGPAVLFWGYLALLVLLAPVLARFPRSPLTTREWVILGLGFTQVPVLVSMLVVGWFFLFAHADKLRPRSAFGYNAFQLTVVFATGVFVTCLLGAVYDGLLSTPEMQVLGNGSSSRELIWYTDRTNGSLTRPWVLTTSLWAWRAAMLAWAVWLAIKLVNWLRWGWDAFSRRGMWKATPKRRSSREIDDERDWHSFAPNSPDHDADSNPPGRLSISLRPGGPDSVPPFSAGGPARESPIPERKTPSEFRPQGAREALDPNGKGSDEEK